MLRRCCCRKPEAGAIDVSASAQSPWKKDYDVAIVIVADLTDWESAGVSIVRTFDELQEADTCNKPNLTRRHQRLYTRAEGKGWSM